MRVKTVSSVVRIVNKRFSTTLTSLAVVSYKILVKAKFHYAIWFELGSKLVADQLRTSFVMEFGFKLRRKTAIITKVGYYQYAADDGHMHVSLMFS